MPAEDGLHVVERAGVEDGLGAFTQFLRRLQHDEHIARRRIAREQECGTDRPRAVNVVAARMHDAGRRGRERESRRLLDRQRVDVAANGDGRRRAVAAGEPRDDARAGDARNAFRPERGDDFREPGRGPLLLPRKLGMLMQIAPQLD